ncbi:MAG: pyocin activator PrtN family protein [Pseudomonas sp.]|nr:pyocin activator PrtN family protein [Pseudomonas sp.]
MNTLFLLMAQYDGQAIIPLAKVCEDYLSHLTPEKLQRKVMAGEVDLPITRMEGSQKSARGVHLQDLAKYLDEQRAKAIIENDKLQGRYKKAS